MLLSQNSNSHKILTHVCNRETFGYIPDKYNDLYDERVESFNHLRIEHLLKGSNKSYNNPLPITKYLKYKKKSKSNIGIDQIYVINLERREDRRIRMENTLEELNLAYNITKAVDGKKIDNDYLKNLRIKSLPGYKDPYSERPLNFGEIGCFLSHYFIWKDIIEKGYRNAIIFEDDAKFELNFKSNLFHFLENMKVLGIQWELLYLGRKIMRDHANEEEIIRNVPSKNNRILMKPSYTHWTVAYALSIQGARKLIDSDPLTKILPVDEFLPLMFNKQPNQNWSSYFEKKDLKAFAIHPPIISPTHYSGDPNYISDTENTQIIRNEFGNDIGSSHDSKKESIKKHVVQIEL